MASKYAPQVGGGYEDAFTPETASSLGSELLATAGPFNLEAWEHAVQQYLDEVEDLGSGISGLLHGEDLGLWLAVAGALVVGGEVARRRARSAQAVAAFPAMGA
jgi:hypothetical protein